MSEASRSLISKEELQLFQFFGWLPGLVTAQVSNTENSAPTMAKTKSDCSLETESYLPNRPYLETQYGSGFIQDSIWADCER